MISAEAFPFVGGVLMAAFGAVFQWLARQSEPRDRAESVYATNVLTAPLFLGAGAFIFIGVIG